MTLTGGVGEEDAETALVLLIVGVLVMLDALVPENDFELVTVEE